MKRLHSAWLALALLGLSCASPRQPAPAPVERGGSPTSREGTTTTTTTQILPDGRVLTTITTTTITDPSAARTGVRLPPTERARDDRAEEPAADLSRRGPRRMDRFAATLPTTLPTTRPGILARTLPSRLEPFDRRLRGQLEVHFIDVGQGDCTLVKCPDGRRLLIDCGTLGNSSYQPVRQYLLQHLDPSEPRVDVLVITHTDSDHYKLLRDVLANVEVGRVVAVDEPDEHHVDGIDEWLGYFAEDQYTILNFDDHVDATAEVLEDFGDVEVLVMAANVQARSSPSNARSIVLKVTFGAVDFMLTGDATKDTERHILNRFQADPAFLDVEVLKVGHHGSGATSTGAPWANAVNPEVSIVSCGYSNGFGHPRAEVIRRLEPHADDTSAHRFREYVSKYEYVNHRAYRKAIYSTGANGNIVVTTDGREYQVAYDQN